jgi:hypothetical protein
MMTWKRHNDRIGKVYIPLQHLTHNEDKDCDETFYNPRTHIKTHIVVKDYTIVEYESAEMSPEEIALHSRKTSVLILGS